MFRMSHRIKYFIFIHKFKKLKHEEYSLVIIGAGHLDNVCFDVIQACLYPPKRNNLYCILN